MRAAANCGEMDRRDECEGGDHGRKCLCRKAGQTWKQDSTAESRVGGGTITIASLSHRQLNNREADPPDA